MMTDTANATARALACLDLACVSAGANEADVDAAAKEACTRHGPVAALSVWPVHVARAASRLKGTRVKVASVVSFPGGDAPISAVIDETKRAMDDGASEIDLVVPWKALLEGHPENIPARVARIKAAADNAPVKAIIESGILAEPETIAAATRGALDGGADFVRTSTGLAPINATPEAARIILDILAAYDRPAGLKVAGTIRSTAEALQYLAMADETLGPENVTPARFRIGSSGLLGALLASLEGRKGVVA